MRLLILFLLALVASTGRAQPCDVTVSFDLPTCPGDADGAIILTPGAGGPFTYNWAHDGTLTGPTANNLAAGPYSVVVSGADGCLSIIDTILPDPIVDPLGTMEVTDITCAGLSDGSVTFTVDPGPYTWEWTDDATITSNVRSDLPGGVYAVAISGGQCTSYVFGELGDPDITITTSTGETDYCPSDPPLLLGELDFGFQPDVYLWSTGATTSNLQVIPGTTGEVTVTAIDTILGCTADGSIFLNELPHPSVAFTAPDSLCIRVNATASVTVSNADSLVWRWGASGFSNESAPVISFTEPGWQPISLQGYYMPGCGSAPVADSVFVRSRIPAVFTAEQIPCTPILKLWLGSASDSCAFFVDDSLMFSACTGWVNLDLRRFQPYELTFYSTQPNRCDDTLAVPIDVRTPPILALPNAFSPNNDGINDTWPGPIDVPDPNYQVQLYDRWGHSLWATTDTQEKWDGDELPIGVYVYTMKMRDPCEPKKQISTNGFVTLLR